MKYRLTYKESYPKADALSPNLAFHGEQTFSSLVEAWNAIADTMQVATKGIHLNPKVRYEIEIEAIPGGPIRDKSSSDTPHKS